MLTAIGGAPAQIPVSSGLSQARSNAPPLLVATPWTADAADSMAAVEIGDGFRERMSRSVVGRDFQVPPRTRMNQYLEEYGYAHDAILSRLPAEELARAMSAYWIVMPELHRGAGGLYRVNARLIGTYPANNGAGFAVEMTQEAGQRLDKFGEKVADLFKPAIKALKETQACLDNQVSDPAKARSAAEKALAVVPNFGLAEFCLGVMAYNEDKTGSRALGHFQSALKTDPLALNAYYKIGEIYQLRSDSVNAVATFQQMLRVDPLNDVLREQAFGLFQRYGRANAAEEVADEGIRNDPNNTDWYDLKSNACLQQEKFACAVDELERLFAIDPSRADSLFFRKISIAGRFAIQGEGGDTAQYIRWVKNGIERYPDDPFLLEDAARAYALEGDADNTIRIAKKLLTIDPENIEPVTRAAAMLAEVGQHERVMEFTPVAVESGNEQLKNALANVLVNGASAARSAGEVERQLLLSDGVFATQTTNEQMRTYAGFFAADALWPRVTPLRTALVDAKSCSQLPEYVALVDRAIVAFELAATHADERIRGFADGILPFLRTEKRETIPSMRTAWKCGGGS
jgi:tetratricopeptide (TPR) repeat protein